MFGRKRRYRVMLEGEGCSIRVGGDESDGTDGEVTSLGFVTTRFVEARSNEQAAAKASELVREELQALLVDQQADDIAVEVSEIEEDPGDYEERAPGSGFTFYRETVQ